MEIEIKRLKDLILATEPTNHMTQVILKANGYGNVGELRPNEYMWSWNIEKIVSLDEHQIEQLIKEITWS